MSVVSVTPGEIAVSSEATAPANGIALGVDGDAQAPSPSPASTTNTAHARLNTFDMLNPLMNWDFHFGNCDARLYTIGPGVRNK
jgi:hypothetical protein